MLRRYAGDNQFTETTNTGRRDDFSRFGPPKGLKDCSSGTPMKD
jgi:hypothetical protein